MLFESFQFLEKDYKKGSFISIEWEKEITLKNGQTVKKLSSGVVRLGIDYGKNFAKQQDNEQKIIKEVKWLMHKFIKESDKGNQLLLCYMSKKNKVKTRYVMNNNEVKLSDISENMYAKDKPHLSNDFTMFTLNISNITRIGNLQGI